MSEETNKNDSDFPLNNSLNESEEFEDIIKNKDSNNNNISQIDLKKDLYDYFNKLIEINKKQNEAITNNINNINQNIPKISNDLHNTCLNLNTLVNTISNNNLNNFNNPFLNCYNLNPNNIIHTDNNMSIPLSNNNNLQINNNMEDINNNNIDLKNEKNNS